MSLYISQSGLNRFVQCPEKWRLAHFWKVIELPRYVTDGIEAHAIMAGEKRNASKRVEALVKHLQDTERELGLVIKPENREVRQEFEYNGMTIIRIIDAIGETEGGLPVLIDYKTTGVNKGMSHAQARGWQSALYLMPPPGDDGSWPKNMLFIVVSSKKLEKIHEVSYDEERQKELDAKLLEVEKFYEEHGYRWAPREFGFQCNRCEFLDWCYRRSNWQVGLQRKK